MCIRDRGQGERGRLGRAVAHDDGDVGAGLPDPSHGGVGHPVTAGPHLAQLGDALRALGRDRREQVRGQPDAGYPVLRAQFAQRVGVQLTRRRHDHPAAGQQRPPQFEGEPVGRRRRVPQHGVGFVLGLRAVHDEPSHVPVGHAYARVRAARVGAVHHGQQVDLAWQERRFGHPFAAGVRRQVVEHDRRHTQPSGQSVGGHRVGEQHARRGLLDHRPDPGHRERRVDRQVGPACLRHPQQGHGQVHRAGQRHRHDRLGSDLSAPQGCGQAARPLVQLPVRHSRVPGEDRDGIGGSLDLAGEQLRNRRPRGVHVRRSRQHPVPLGTAHHVNCTDGQLWVGGQQGPDVREQLLAVEAQFLAGVQDGRGVEPEVEVAVRASVGVDADREFVEGPDRRADVAGRAAGEVELLRELDDVDDGAEASATAEAGSARALDVRVVAGGVAEDLVRLVDDGVGDLGEGRGQGDSHPHRHHVRGKAGCRAGDSDAVSHGQREQELRVLAAVSEKHRRGGGQQGRHPYAHGLRGLGPGVRLGARDGQRAAGHADVVGQPRPAVGVAHGFGERGPGRFGQGDARELGGRGRVLQVGTPELRVVGERPGVPVRGALGREGLGVPQVGQLRYVHALHQRRVHLGEAP